MLYVINYTNPKIGLCSPKVRLWCQSTPGDESAIYRYVNTTDLLNVILNAHIID